MTTVIDVSNIPSSDVLARDFAAAAITEPASSYIDRVYKTGVMFDVAGQRELINETSVSMREGRILWYLARALQASLVIETGFGRGGSAAFFLSAIAPASGQVISIDPAFRHWAGDIGQTYIKEMGCSQNHTLIEIPSEIYLAEQLHTNPDQRLKLGYVDGSHHFDGTLFDFMLLDRMLEVGGVIGIDDAHAPAVRTVASFVANNLPYKLNFATPRLVLCQKMAEPNRNWDHFRPFTCSQRRDWDVHPDAPLSQDFPNATFGYEAP